jgi:hypothetical protein
LLDQLKTKKNHVSIPSPREEADPASPAQATLPFIVRDQRQWGWYFVDNEIIDKYGPELGAYGVAVYTVLCRHSWRSRTQQVDISQRDIAAYLKISQDAVRKSIHKLVTLGLVHAEVPDRGSQSRLSRFWLLNVKERPNATRSDRPATERQAFGSTHEPNATRSRNKEERQKQKENGETEQPPLPLGRKANANAKSNSNYSIRDRLERELDILEAREREGGRG